MGQGKKSRRIYKRTEEAQILTVHGVTTIALGYQMIDKIKSAIKKGLFYGGYYKFLEASRKPPGNRLLILMYHNFVDAATQKSNWFYRDSPNPSQFEAALITLKKDFRVITVEDAVKELIEHGTLLQKSIAITIDDGYLSSYNIAYPLLKKHGLRATVYLTTDWIGKQIYPWWRMFGDFVANSTISNELIGKIEALLNRSIELNIAAINGDFNRYHSLYTKVENIIRRMDDSSRLDILENLRNIFIGDQSIAQNKENILTWGQIREMSSYGIRFGAHTCSHINLSYSELDSAEREIAESKRKIEQSIDSPVDGFAYPYGHDIVAYEKFVPVLKKHDYKYACASMTGNVVPGSDLFMLHRLHMPLSTSRPIMSRTLSLEYLAESY